MRAIRALRRRAAGQSLALFAVLLPGLLALCALGLDAGNLYVERREMQAAADLAALSGARMLPNAASAISRAQTIAAQNGYTATVTVTTPYSGDATKIQVAITKPLPTLFLRVLGVSTMDVSARSVAQTVNVAAASGQSYAIFAGQNSCAGIPSDTYKWTGTNSKITGLIHSNAGIKVSSGGGVWTGGTEYKCNAAFVDSGSGNVYTPSPTKVPTDVAMPVTWTWNDFCATGGTYYHATGKWDLSQPGAWWVGGTNASKKLNPGVYCADGTTTAQIVMATGGVSGNVTLVSRGVIQLSGGTFAWTAFKNNAAMVAFGSGSQVIKSSAGGTSPTGVLYAPNGEIVFTGPSGGVYNGAMIGWTVNVTGSNFTLVGSAAQAAAPVQQLRLIE